MKLATLACRFFEAPTSDAHIKMLIADDSIYELDRSKKVELLARVFLSATAIPGNVWPCLY